jgi:hypothetical protein
VSDNLPGAPQYLPIRVSPYGRLKADSGEGSLDRRTHHRGGQHGSVQPCLKPFCDLVGTTQRKLCGAPPSAVGVRPGRISRPTTGRAYVPLRRPAPASAMECPDRFRRQAPRGVAATLTIPKHPPMKPGTDVRPVRGYRVMRVPSTRGLLLSRSSRRSRLRTSAARVGAPDSCGCAMGARLIAAGLVASTVWYVWHRHALGLSIWGVCVRVAAWSVLAGCVGKAIGLLRYRRLRTAQVTAGSVR